MSAPSFTYTIKISQLDGKTPLPNGDVVSITPAPGTPGTITFTLTQPKGRWWKGLVYFEAREINKWTEIAAGSGDELNDPEYAKKTGQIGHATMAAGFLVLSRTAPGAGWHANMYLLADAAGALEDGKSYTIDWITD